MKRNKVLALLAAAVLLAGCLGACRPQPVGVRHKVALVGKSSTSEFFRSVYAGAQAAAAEYNLELSIFSPETEEDYETQNQLVAEAVENGAEALVFSACDYENNAAAIDAAAAKGVRIVSIDSNVASENVQIYIGTDNYAAGKMAAEAALAEVSGELVVGIVNHDVRSANGQEREQGARAAFADSGRARVAAAVNTVAEAGQAQADAAAMLAAHPEIHVLLAFNEPTSVGAAAAVAQMGLSDQVFLVGFDSHVATVEALQTGAVDALVVQNPYAMGYLGVESAYRLLAGQGAQLPKTMDTSTRVVTLETLFTVDSQKALFAFQ